MKLFVLLVAILVLSLGCATSANEAAEISFTEAFVLQSEVLLHTKPDDPLGRAGDIVVWHNKIAVADPLASNVKVFDPDGKLLMTIGRLGRGPGEFMRPTSLAVDDSGRLVVLDILLGRISFFTRAGSLVGAFRINGARTESIVALGQGSKFLINTRIVDPQSRQVISPYVAHIFNRQGEVLESFGQAPEARTRAETPFMGSEVAVVDDSILIWGTMGRHTLFMQDFDQSSGNLLPTDTFVILGLTPLDWENAPDQELSALTDWVRNYPLLMDIFSGPGFAVARFMGGDTRQHQQWYRYAFVSTQRKRTIAVTKRTPLLVQYLDENIAYGITIKVDGNAYLGRYYFRGLEIIAGEVPQVAGLTDL